MVEVPRVLSLVIGFVAFVAAAVYMDQTLPEMTIISYLIAAFVGFVATSVTLVITEFVLDRESGL